MLMETCVSWCVAQIEKLQEENARLEKERGQFEKSKDEIEHWLGEAVRVKLEFETQCRAKVSIKP
jgi:hypothetical protein